MVDAKSRLNEALQATAYLLYPSMCNSILESLMKALHVRQLRAAGFTGKVQGADSRRSKVVSHGEDVHLSQFFGLRTVRCADSDPFS